VQFPASGSGRFGGFDGSRRPALGVGLADVDSALEERAILNADTGGSYIAAERAFRADIHTVGRGDIAANLAQNHDFAGSDVGGHLAVTSHGDAIPGKIDAALDLAVDEQ